MAAVIRFPAQGDQPGVYVEVDPDSPGLERISRGRDGVVDAGRTIEEALASVRPAIENIARTLTSLAPASWTMEFGIKLNAEIGVLIAKSAVEGNFVVRLSWSASEK